MAKPSTIQNRIDKLEAERATLAAQLGDLTARRDALSGELDRAQAEAVRNGTPEAAQDVEQRAAVLDRDHQRTTAALRAVDADLTEQRAALVVAETQAKHDRRAELRAERDRVLAQMDVNPADRALWLQYQALYDEDVSLAKDLFGHEVTLGGAPGRDTLWVDVGQLFKLWMSALESHIFRRGAPITLSSAATLKWKHV